MAHKFRTGAWAKRQITPKDHFHFLFHSSPVQRSLIHEIASQQLGHSPGPLWGVPVPQEWHIPTDQHTLTYVRQAATQPSHEFGRLIASHKKAAGWASAISDAMSSGAKTAGKYAVKVGKFVATHGEDIQKGTAIVKDLVQTGSSIASIAGLIDSGTQSQIDAIASRLAQHATGEHYFGKKVAKKKGGKVRI